MTHAVGSPVPRKEGWDKVIGRTKYVDDVVMEGMLHGATIRSPVPRGRIVDIRFEGDIPWDEFVVVTAQDIPEGHNVVALMEDDQPYLADGVVNHAQEPVALIAHPDRHLVQVARAHVVVEVEPLPSLEDIDEALAGDLVVWGEDNLFKTITVDKGDVDSVWDSAHLIVEGRYETPAQEQLYIEPQGMIATYDAEAGVTVWGSLQCPYYVHKALMRLFGLDGHHIRVVQTATGGGFGGKEEYPSVIAGHAALLAQKAGRPVKIIYDRAEDMAATTKRHPSRTLHRTALDADGRLLAMDIDFALDGGAYLTLSPVVLSRGVIHAAGPYKCDNVRILGRAVATNLPPHGAFRGFGAPQSIFALERHLDRCARAAGLDPVEFRRRNLLHRGESTATEHTIDEAIDLDALVDSALEKSGWADKAAAHAAHNADPEGTTRRGLGMSVFFHGSGFTGSGEVYLASVVKTRADAEGRVTILAASTEIGQGTQTIFSQIASDALDVPYEWIEVAQPDTANVPNSGPTVASRTTMVVGKLVERASRDIARQLQGAGLLAAEGYSAEDFAAACRAWLETHETLEGEAIYKPPPGVEWDDKRYRGAAYGAYGWAAYVAEVEVDTVTWEARVLEFHAVQDIGTVIHPVLAAGQVQGGVAQAIGYALYEDVAWRGGSMANNRMTNYIMPTSADLPDIHVHFQPVPWPYGPSGAKGVGELPMDGPAPAVLSAIEDATGLSLTRLPASPEALMRAAQEAAHA